MPADEKFRCLKWLRQIIFRSRTRQECGGAANKRRAFRVLGERGYVPLGQQFGQHFAGHIGQAKRSAVVLVCKPQVIEP
jgi:hypothetical protein